MDVTKQKGGCKNFIYGNVLRCASTPCARGPHAPVVRSAALQLSRKKSQLPLYLLSTYDDFVTRPSHERIYVLVHYTKRPRTGKVTPAGVNPSDAIWYGASAVRIDSITLKK